MTGEEAFIIYLWLAGIAAFRVAYGSFPRAIMDMTVGRYPRFRVWGNRVMKQASFLALFWPITLVPVGAFMLTYVLREAHRVSRESK